MKPFSTHAEFCDVLHRAVNIPSPISSTTPTTNTRLLPHGAGSPLSELALLGLLFSDTLGEDSTVFVGSILGGLSSTTLERDPMTFVLKTLGSNETLDLGSLGVWLLSLTLWLNFTTDDELANIIILGETKESSNLGGSLGPKTLWLNRLLIGQSRDCCIAHLHN